MDAVLADAFFIITTTALFATIFSFAMLTDVFAATLFADPLMLAMQTYTFSTTVSARISTLTVQTDAPATTGFALTFKPTMRTDTSATTLFAGILAPTVWTFFRGPCRRRRHCDVLWFRRRRSIPRCIFFAIFTVPLVLAMQTDPCATTVLTVILVSAM